MPALRAYIAGVNSIQYTVRCVPADVDRRARQQADETKQSLNAVLLDALRKGLGVENATVRHHDMDDLVGTWAKDPEFAAAIASMDKIDPELWK